ncbi:hypothetical protein [Macrococcus armenti]|uniref:hypothetical protein n=1 Tax=Macrococcus armenti TaxID=2875764 RepID=UPI001CD7EBA5|nr:hypothetical protein [Macrococcus armenti]UBH11312.1 hypothetical protein LAU38_02270 [Macrococcus armenti]
MVNILNMSALNKMNKTSLVEEMDFHYFNMIELDSFNIEQLNEYVSNGNRNNISRFVSTMVVIERLIADYRTLSLVEQDESEIIFFVEQVNKKNEVLSKIAHDNRLLEFIDDEVYEILYV